MNFIDSSEDRPMPRGSEYSKARRRRRVGGRRRRRLVYDRLECRQLLALSAPVAEFPARTSGGIPVGSVVDPNGNDWVLLSSGNIAEIGNSGSVVAQFTVPSYNALAGAPTGSELGLITYDAVDGDLWFYETNSNRFGMLNPTSGAITEYPALFFAANPAIYEITAGSDGNIWFTEPDLNEVGVFDIKTDVISQFTMPLPDTQPQGIAAGPDGNVWFTEGGLNQLGTINPVSHVLSNYPYEPPGYTNNDQAEGITAGPNNTIWFVETQNNQVMEFSITSQTFTSFAPVPPNPVPNPLPPAQLWSIGQGPDGNIYYTETAPAYDSIGELNPATNSQIWVHAVNNQGQPTQNPPNLASALVASEDTTGATVFVTVPAIPELIALNVNNLANGLTLGTLPAVSAANDANDVVSDDNELWYTDTTDSNGAIEEFNPATQLNTLYELPEFPPPPNPPPAQPPPQDPDQMTVDDSGNIWFTENAVNSIGEFDPSTGTFSQTLLTAVSSAPTAIAWDSIEQEIWMTEPSLESDRQLQPGHHRLGESPDHDP